MTMKLSSGTKMVRSIARATLQDDIELFGTLLHVRSKLIAPSDFNFSVLAKNHFCSHHHH